MFPIHFEVNKHVLTYDWNLDQVVDFRSNIYMKPKFKFSNFGEISRKFPKFPGKMIKIRQFSGKFWKFPGKMMFGSFGFLKWKNYFFTQISSCHQNFIDRSASKQHYDFSYLEWSDIKIEDFEFHVDLYPTWSRFPSWNSGINLYCMW